MSFFESVRIPLQAEDQIECLRAIRKPLGTGSVAGKPGEVEGIGTDETWQKEVGVARATQ